MLMDTTHPPHPHGDDDLHIKASADAHAAAVFSREVRGWLARNVVVDDQRRSDIVLATYEALANCADHAYRGLDRIGEMTLHVSYDTPTATVQICVQDQGRWIEPDTRPTTRGRGLLLMRSLADDISVNGRTDGTTICLHFAQCAAALPRHSTLSADDAAESSASAHH